MLLSPSQAKRLLPYLQPYTEGKTGEHYVTAPMIRAAIGLEPLCLLECPGCKTETAVVSEGGFGRTAHIIDKEVFAEYANSKREMAI